jgi:hypothetical protein
MTDCLHFIVTDITFQTHTQCSETFYRNEVEKSINSEPLRSAEEKLKMMELLKRLEQQSHEDGPNLLDDDDDADEHTDDDLAHRMGGTDISKP